MVRSLAAMQKSQRAKAAIKPPMKGDSRYQVIDASVERRKTHFIVVSMRQSSVSERTIRTTKADINILWRCNGETK